MSIVKCYIEIPINLHRVHPDQTPPNGSGPFVYVDFWDAGQ